MATVATHDMLNDGESEAGPAKLAAAVAINAVKPLRQPGKMLFRDPLPLVNNRNAGLATIR